jgi:hypothetical protein
MYIHNVYIALTLTSLVLYIIYIRRVRVVYYTYKTYTSKNITICNVLILYT